MTKSFRSFLNAKPKNTGYVDLGAVQVHESPGLGERPSIGYVDFLQNPDKGKKRLGGLVCTQQAGLQPACAGMHPPPQYTAFTRGFANLRAGACRPARLCMQPGARASPYRSGLGRPSARCLQPEVESRRAGLAWQP
jgi:hypothetical protein